MARQRLVHFVLCHAYGFNESRLIAMLRLSISAVQLREASFRGSASAPAQRHNRDLVPTRPAAYGGGKPGSANRSPSDRLCGLDNEREAQVREALTRFKRPSRRKGFRCGFRRWDRRSAQPGGTSCQQTALHRAVRTQREKRRSSAASKAKAGASDAQRKARSTCPSVCAAVKRRAPSHWRPA